MDADKRRTPIALFAALTRAVREEAMPEPLRARAYAALDVLSACVGAPPFSARLEELRALATEHAELHDTVQPFMPELGALVTAGWVAPADTPPPTTSRPRRRPLARQS